MPDVPDLDALREKAEAIIAAEGQFMSGYEARRIELAFQNAWTPERCLAVLALVEEQRARISTLERQNATLASSRDLAMRLARNAQERVSDLQSENDRLRLALAGSPAENKEPT